MVSLLAGVLVARCFVFPVIKLNDSSGATLPAYEVLVAKQADGDLDLLMLNSLEGTTTSFHNVEGVFSFFSHPNQPFAEIKATDPVTGTTIFLNAPGQKWIGSIYDWFSIGSEKQVNMNSARCHAFNPAPSLDAQN